MNDGRVGENNFNSGRGKLQVGGANGTGKISGQSNENPQHVKNDRSTESASGVTGTGVPVTAGMLKAQNFTTKPDLKVITGGSNNVINAETRFRPVTGHPIDEQLKDLNTIKGYERLEKQAKSKQKPDSGILVLKGPEFDQALEERLTNLSTVTPQEHIQAIKARNTTLDNSTGSVGAKPPTTAELIKMFHSDSETA
mgnify:CR=1 FL=1